MIRVHPALSKVNWQRVEASGSSLLHDMNRWCDETGGGRYTSANLVVRGEDRLRPTFWFEHKVDAAKFKLVFG